MTGLWKTRAATGSKLIFNEIEENKIKDHCVKTNYVMPRSALMKAFNYIGPGELYSMSCNNLQWKVI